MRIFKTFLLALTLAFGAVASAASPAAAEGRALLIKIVNDDPHRLHGALMFADTMAKEGHPVTLWITDRAVRVASKEHAGNLAGFQTHLDALVKNKARIMICPMCMSEYGVKEGDLIPGMTIGEPALLDQILFKDDAKVISW